MADSNDDCVFESDSDHNESSETLTETESQSVSKEKVKKENQSYGAGDKYELEIKWVYLCPSYNNSNHTKWYKCCRCSVRLKLVFLSACGQQG